MNSMDWLKRRRELAAEAEICALEPSQTPINPRAAEAPPREIPDKSPRIPEDSYLNICTNNIFSLGKEEEKNIIEAKGNIGGLGALGARRGLSGTVGAETEPKGSKLDRETAISSEQLSLLNKEPAPPPVTGTPQAAPAAQAAVTFAGPEPPEAPAQPLPTQTDKTGSQAPVTKQAARPPLPYLTPGGTLVIPFDSDPKYHWWKGGQSVKETMAEVLARMAASREPADDG